MNGDETLEAGIEGENPLMNPYGGVTVYFTSREKNQNRARNILMSANNEPKAR